MERMRISVRTIELLCEHDLAVARVSATSARKVAGRPVARINLKMVFKVPRRGEAVGVLQERAKDEALAFLDVT